MTALSVTFIFKQALRVGLMKSLSKYKKQKKIVPCLDY